MSLCQFRDVEVFLFENPHHCLSLFFLFIIVPNVTIFPLIKFIASVLLDQCFQIFHASNSRVAVV